MVNIPIRAFREKYESGDSLLLSIVIHPFWRWIMGKAHSTDLRVRVYAEVVGGNSRRAAARRFYPDFAQWVAWGEALLTLHIGYDDVKPFKLTRVDTPVPKRAEGTQLKPKLKSVVPETGTPNRDVPGSIIIDEDTQLTGIPAAAWDYRLGNRSAIDWVLDQHKEKTPRDPTIRAKFNTYRFADYKESCIALRAKVVTVSVETVAITEAMKSGRQ